MAGSAQLWPGPRMQAFFRSLLAAEPGVDAELADRLSARLIRHVARMLVWDAEPVPAPPATDEAGAAPGLDTPPTTSGSAAAPPETAQSTPAAAASPPAASPPAPDEGFDPFAFSIVVVLKRQGRVALLERLENITDARHLHQMATAQHLGVDKSITSVEALREAILEGAAQRLADRRAAAS